MVDADDVRDLRRLRHAAHLPTRIDRLRSHRSASIVPVQPELSLTVDAAHAPTMLRRSSCTVTQTAVMEASLQPLSVGCHEPAVPRLATTNVEIYAGVSREEMCPNDTRVVRMYCENQLVAV